MTSNILDNFSLVKSVNNIKNELICNICLDVFYIPITLPNCLHTFCYKCVNNILSYNNIICPICRKNNNINNLNMCKNNIIKNIVQHINKSPICNTHDKEVVKYYCKNCRDFICMCCKSDEIHKKHSIILIKKNAPKMIIELNKKQTSIEENKKIINNEIKLLKKIKNMSSKNYEKDKKIIESEFNLLECTLNEKKQIILEELKYKYLYKYENHETCLLSYLNLLNFDLDNIKRIINNDNNLFK